ncbi:FRIGIDA-like protein 5 [Linum perenne]
MPISISEESIWPQMLQDDPLPSPLSSDEVTTALGNSDDPAKMVFNEIKCSLMRYGKKRTEPCDESVPRYQVLLLQQLISGSSVVSPRVKEEAKELAVTWRASLGQAALDSLAFLLFLAAYKLAPRFEEDDVLKLAENITHYTKAPELWSALGLKEKLPALIKRLVKRDMYMEAARFSCAFCLVDDYPPHLIVLKFLEKTCTLEKGRLLLESQVIEMFSLASRFLPFSILLLNMDLGGRELQSEAFNKHMDYLKQLIQRVQELNFDRNLVNWKLVEHFQDLARMLEREKSCILGVAAIIPQVGSKQYHYNEAIDTSTIGQSSAAAAHQYYTAFREEEQKSTCQDGNLTHQGQINKRSRTDSQ